MFFFVFVLGIPCPLIPHMDNAFTVPNEEEFYFGDQVTYICKYGYWFDVNVDHVTVTCSAEARWLPEMKKKCSRKFNIVILPSKQQIKLLFSF